MSGLEPRLWVMEGHTWGQWRRGHVSPHAAEPITVSGTTHTIEWTLCLSLSGANHNNSTSIQTSWPHWHVGPVSPCQSPSTWAFKTRQGLSITSVWLQRDSLHGNRTEVWLSWAPIACAGWIPRGLPQSTVSDMMFRFYSNFKKFWKGHGFAIFVFFRLEKKKIKLQNEDT